MLIRMLVIVLMISACGRTISKAPLEKYPRQERIDGTEKVILAKPPCYGCKIL